MSKTLAGGATARARTGEHAAKRFESLDANGDGALRTRDGVEGALTRRGG
jgi:hypothetical protein